MPHELETILPDGYIIETSPAAEQWWTEAAGILQRGRLLTVDYGLTANDLFSPHRLKGTLRAYHRHHVTDDVLGNAGAQDITAHVNFDAIQTAGEKAGLATEVFCTQAQFLTGILAHLSRGNQPMDWTPARTRQFQTLTHPEHLGRAFRVLVQKR